MRWTALWSTLNQPKIRRMPSHWTNLNSENQIYVLSQIHKTEGVWGKKKCMYFPLHQVSIPAITNPQFLRAGVLHPVSVNFPWMYHLSSSKNRNPSESLQGKILSFLDFEWCDLLSHLFFCAYFHLTLSFACVSTEPPNGPVCTASAGLGTGFWQLHEWRKQDSRASWRLHIRHSAKTEGR